MKADIPSISVTASCRVMSKEERALMSDVPEEDYDAVKRNQGTETNPIIPPDPVPFDDGDEEGRQTD